MSIQLITAIVQTCADTPRGSIEKACALLSDQKSTAQEALPSLTGVLAKQALTRLKKALKDSATTAQELALALLATSAGIEAGRATPDIQLVWTGPDTPKAAPRDTLPQMLEMIGRAESSILLVTFAAFKATAIMEALKAAAGRGVKLKIIVESADDSAGQLSHDSWKAFPESFIKAGCVWFWPIAKRPKNAKGMPGKLHAKCLVIDNREVLVSSANLTDDAMERNIEIGIRCSINNTAAEIVRKFDELKMDGHLVQAAISQR